MSYKIGLILSFTFIIQIILLVGDLISIQMVYTNLDAVSVSAGYLISSKGGITQEIVDLVKQESNADIYPIDNSVALYGQPYKFQISSQYNPFIMGKENIEITITRSVVIGYFN